MQRVIILALCVATWGCGAMTRRLPVIVIPLIAPPDVFAVEDFQYSTPMNCTFAPAMSTR